jgi:uroporphyrinogen-III decarboxylase
MFMSPETYRQLLVPLHTRIVKECKELDIIPIQHTCGKADLIVQEMIDEGNHGWNAVQSTNDIETIIEKHGDEFVIIGGYNTTGAPGLEDVSEEDARAETRRCLETYAKYGKGYVFSGFVMMSGGADANPFLSPANMAITDEFMKFRAEQTA